MVFMVLYVFFYMVLWFYMFLMVLYGFISVALKSCCAFGGFDLSFVCFKYGGF